MRQAWALAAMLLAACGEQQDAAIENDVAPQPSGAPVVAQVESEAPPTTTVEPASEPGTLRFVGADGSLRMEVTCRGKPANLFVHVPSFTAIGSEDRFALGIGGEPVTLVADPTLQRAGEGVRAEGPAPDNFAALVAGSRELSGNYGAQIVGPFAWASRAAADAFAAACAAR